LFNLRQACRAQWPLSHSSRRSDFSAALGNFGGTEFACAGAVDGNNNLAVMIGTDSNANAGHVLSSPGNNNLAVVLGNNSNANALDGNRNLAAVLGNDLSATAMGGHMTDSVTFLGTL